MYKHILIYICAVTLFSPTKKAKKCQGDQLGKISSHLDDP